MRQNQAIRIVEYIRDHGSITALEAMRDLGCYRLAARIHDIKEMSYEIERDFVSVPNRHGESTQIARYSISE
jgi:hypothetical protein